MIRCCRSCGGYCTLGISLRRSQSGGREPVLCTDSSGRSYRAPASSARERAVREALARYAPTVTTDYERFEADYHAHFARLMPELLAQTDLVGLETVTVKLTFVCERGDVRWPVGEEGGVLRSLVFKLVHELHAVAGCVRSGTVLGAHHHVRALLELRAVAHYLFDPNASDRVARVERFTEWPNVAPYLYQRRREKERDEGKRSVDAFDAATKGTRSSANPSPNELARWERIYGSAISKGKPKEWHGQTIADLLWQADPPGDLIHQYDAICNAAHVSPIASGFVDSSGLALRGWTEGRGEGAVTIAITQASIIIDILDAHCAGAFGPMIEPEVRLVFRKLGLEV